MRKINLFLLGIVAILMASCTQNNGNIGFWFGTWQCTEITVDGEPEADYNENLFFKFQTNVCNIVFVSPHNDFSQFFCEFKPQGDGTIILDCSHTSGIDTWHDYEFDIPEGIPFVKGENVLSYSKINSRNVKLTFANEGKTITYTLKKQ